MRLNKLAKKIFAAGLAVSLMMANAGVSFADPTTNTGTDFTFKKYLVMDEGANVPNAEITFEIKPGQHIDRDAEKGTMEVYAGVGEPSITPAKFDNKEDAKYTTPQQGDTITLDEGKAYAKKSVTVDFSGVQFTEPGVYRYVITEKNCTNSAVTLDTAPKYLDVYYMYNTEGTALGIEGYVLHTTNDAPKETNGTTADGQDNKIDSITNTYNSHNLYVKKVVAGNQGSKNKYFTFTVKLTGEVGTVYDVDTSDTTKAGQTTQLTITDKETKTATAMFYLKDGEHVVIKGLAVGDQYVVTEDAEDYRSEVLNEEESGYKDATNGTMADVDIKTGFKNTREGTIPTGVILDSAPFILIIGLAAAALIITAARKKVR